MRLPPDLPLTENCNKKEIKCFDIRDAAGGEGRGTEKSEKIQMDNGEKNHYFRSKAKDNGEAGVNEAQRRRY